MISKIHSYKVIPSTNRIAFELAEAGASHGEIVCAGSQTEGRGRLGKRWLSPSGKGLYFSIIVRPDLPKEDYAKITMTTGLAMAEVLEELCGAAVQLKWPNDIMLSERKCGGILCEASLDSEISERRFAIIGIGLNVLTEKDDFPEELQASATSLFIETGKYFSLDEVRNRIVEQVLRVLSTLEQEGFSPILRQWASRDFLEGKWLQWLTHGGEVILARAEGPDEDGRLLVRDKDGKLHQVLSGDVTLAGKHQKKGAVRDEHGSSSTPDPH